MRRRAPTIGFSGALDSLDVSIYAPEKLLSLAGCGGPYRLEVATSEADVGIRTMGLDVEVQERLRPEVKVWRVAPHVD
jgi:hypothetical protein